MRLTEKDEGAEVLLLCYNNGLSRFLRDLVSRRKLERGRIIVYQWEELAQQLLSACGMDNEAPASEAGREDKLRYYDQELPALLLECVLEAEFTDRLPRFDALIVDEAQDHDTAFPDSLNGNGSGGECGWWSIFFDLLRESTKASIALFYDTPHPTHPPPFRGPGAFDARLIAWQLSQSAFDRLPHALRYTQPIYDFLQTLNSPGTEGLVSQLSEPDDLPEGLEVIMIYTKEASTEEVRAQVAEIISGWVEIGYCLPEEVLILHTRTELKASVLGPCATIA